MTGQWITLTAAMRDILTPGQELSELSTTMDELTKRRRTLIQTGFNQQAGDVQQQLHKLREAADAKRREMEQKLYKQRLWMLELSQKHEVMRAQPHSHVFYAFTFLRVSPNCHCRIVIASAASQLISQGAGCTIPGPLHTLRSPRPRVVSLAPAGVITFVAWPALITICGCRNHLFQLV